MILQHVETRLVAGAARVALERCIALADARLCPKQVVLWNSYLKFCLQNCRIITSKTGRIIRQLAILHAGCFRAAL